MKDNLVIVVEEISYCDNERAIIGVCTSVDNAEILIDEFFGNPFKHEKNYRDDLQFSDIVYERDVDWDGGEEIGRSKIILTYFELDK